MRNLCVVQNMSIIKRKFNNKKAIALLLSSLFFSQLFFVPYTSAGTRAQNEHEGRVIHKPDGGKTTYDKGERAPDSVEAGKNDPIGSALLGMMGGIPIGKTVSYIFQFSGIRSFPVCATSNGAPEVGDNVKAICYNTPMPGVKSHPVVNFTMFDTEDGGAKSNSMNFSTEAMLFSSTGESRKITGTLTTQINADVYQGSTGLSGGSGITGFGDNQWGWSNGIAPGNNDSLSSWKNQDVTAEDACTKYGVACGKSQEEADKEMCSKYNVNCGDSNKNTFSKEAVDRANKTGDICGSLGNAFCGSQSPPKANQVDWKSGKGIGSQVGDLLNDTKNGNGSFSSSDNDWMNANGGGKGEKNLDGFFGNDNSFNSPGDYPNGLTTDSFGLDGGEADKNGDLPLFNSSGVDTYGKAGYNPADFANEDGNFVNDADFGADYGNNNFSDILQDTLNDGLNKGGSLFEDTDKSNSLAGMIHNLLSGDENGLNTNNDKSTLSNQDLFDIAKRLLLESGLTEDDILKGVNYDKDSAYTEPKVAWDFNRMTTLLKGRKVKFDNQHEIHQKPKTKSGSGGFGM